jgi:hypothetical protein
MTLLIGTVSDKHAVITADGLSRVNPVTGAGVGSDTFRKVFPVASLPIAFVHHGLNILGGKPIDEFIEGYISAHATALLASGIKDIAEHLRSYAEQNTQDALAHPTNKGVVGFWIAGFGAGKGKPELYEICWPDKPAPYKHEGIVLGGDAKEFIELYLSQPLGPFRPENIPKSSVSFILQYHQALYKQAESKQAKTGQTIFGGHQHQLVLKKTGWEWTRPPK